MSSRADGGRYAPERLRERIPEDLLSFTFSASPGPGGQNVNKLNTKATLWFDLDGTDALTEPEKRRVRDRLAGRVGNDGRLRVVSSRFRTQRANRDAAAERFYELLSSALTPRKRRKPTRPTASSKRRRLEEKRRTGKKKRERSAARRANVQD